MGYPIYKCKAIIDCYHGKKVIYKREEIISAVYIDDKPAIYTLKLKKNEKLLLIEKLNLMSYTIWTRLKEAGTI